MAGDREERQQDQQSEPAAEATGPAAAPGVGSPLMRARYLRAKARRASGGHGAHSGAQHPADDQLMEPQWAKDTSPNHGNDHHKHRRHSGEHRQHHHHHEGGHPEHASHAAVAAETHQVDAVKPRSPAISRDAKAELESALSASDSAAIFRIIDSADAAMVASVARDTVLLGRLEALLGLASGNQLRGHMARKVVGVQAELAFWLLQANDAVLQQERFDAYGSVSAQRALSDAVVASSADGERVKQAFHQYWGVECTTMAGATNWPTPVLKAMHLQLKRIPDQDTRSGVWKQLALTSDPSLISRAAYANGTFYVGSNANTSSTISMGYGTKLAVAAAAGSTTLHVTDPTPLKAGDSITLDSGSARDTAKIRAVSGAIYSLDKPLGHSHVEQTVVARNDATGARQVNWLDATVRHEIGHSVESALGGVTGYTVGLGGWWTGDDFDQWAHGMGNPWATSDGSTIPDPDKAQIKKAIVEAVASRTSNLATSVPADHPINKHWAKKVPVIVAANACLQYGDAFYQHPESIYAANGRRFSISYWYKKFMYHKEEVLDQRVSDYSLYAPAEFFAEAYTVFYEQAGKPEVSEDRYGQLIRNASWRGWIRTNIHERGHHPAGTHADPSTPGAVAGGASVGKKAGNPG